MVYQLNYPPTSDTIRDHCVDPYPEPGCSEDLVRKVTLVLRGKVRQVGKKVSKLLWPPGGGGEGGKASKVRLRPYKWRGSIEFGYWHEKLN